MSGSIFPGLLAKLAQQIRPVGHRAGTSLDWPVRVPAEKQSVRARNHRRSFEILHYLWETGVLAPRCFTRDLKGLR